jgi:glutathione S-transferase
MLAESRARRARLAVGRAKETSAVRLYDNAFSPFARKVRLVLELKGMSFETVDGLEHRHRDELLRANPRVEVPALDDGGVLVVGSSDIALYLERVKPEPSVYPQDAAAWVKARAWERAADTAIDPVLINLSYWLWAERSDARPEAWLSAGKRDLGRVYDTLERELDGRDFVCGALSIADISLFPHLVSTKMLGVSHDPERHPRVDAWLRRLRAIPEFAADLRRTREFMVTFLKGTQHERAKIFWRGDRIEWLLANGFHDWFFAEIANGRVLWPGFGAPA